MLNLFGGVVQYFKFEMISLKPKLKLKPKPKPKPKVLLKMGE